MYNESNLVSFGNFLLSRYNVQVYSSDGKNIPIHQREVSDADMANWKDGNPIKDFHTLLPSRFTIGQPVWFRLWEHDIIGEVLCVHFYEGKVKYDLELLGRDGDKTRVYNIDSCYVADKIPEGEKVH